MFAPQPCKRAANDFNDNAAAGGNRAPNWRPETETASRDTRQPRELLSQLQDSPDLPRASGRADPSVAETVPFRSSFAGLPHQQVTSNMASTVLAETTPTVRPPSATVHPPTSRATW